ncbi:MAG: metallophosphoesterase [Anaerolineae bacterium]|nr:metallophosphoesterase [Anaerolineae bacterium]MDW8297814.1 metallophosphoesterase [Anaerolineae bacterium]
MLRFVHISDSHISTPDFAHYGHRSYPNFEAVVSAINALPFKIDFVLHTGDVVENGAAEEYALAKPLLAQLRFPIYYANGNHDNSDLLQRELIGIHTPNERYDCTFSIKGVQIAILDSSNRRDHTGILTESQLEALRSLCTSEGVPLIIALHHPPVPLDTPWLDSGWCDSNGELCGTMLLENWQAFQSAIAPARARLRGVFFGHIHHACQVWNNGILYCAAPSTFGQLASYPEQRAPQPTPEQPIAFNLVSIDGEQVIVRQVAIPRPATSAA